MRMKDLRLSDNRGLAHASSLARDKNKHLVVMHCLSPNDFKAHKRSARRIDFVLRNLRSLKVALDELNIPLHILNVTPRKNVPLKVADWAQSIHASVIVANIEYEVDELRQLIHLFDAVKERNISLTCKRVKIETTCGTSDLGVYTGLHDHCIARPGTILTKEGRPQTVFELVHLSESNTDSIGTILGL